VTDQLELNTATRRQQRIVLAVAIAFAVLGGVFLTAAAVVVWATTNHP
jgi:hypothetical protein